MFAHRMASNPAPQMLRFAAHLLTAAPRPAIHLSYPPTAVPSLQPRLPHPVVVVALSLASHLPHPLMEAPRLAPSPHHQGLPTYLPWAPPKNDPAHQENVKTQRNLETNLRIRRLINLNLNNTPLSCIATWIVFEKVKLNQIWHAANCVWPGHTSRVLVSMPSIWVYGRVKIVVDC